MNSSYLTSAQKASQLPEFTQPEIAFIGRSNSGKSSLLNNLLGRKKLVKTSAKPGSTQMVNFFMLELKDKHQLIFADLPGYGYQSAGGAVRKNWDELMDRYVQRENICAFLCLADIRRDWEPFELEFMFRQSRNVPITVVLTKIDKLNAKELAKRKKEITDQLSAEGISFHGFHLVSNQTGKGIAALQEELFAYSLGNASS
jgi:GTP-binding protein